MKDQDVVGGKVAAVRGALGFGEIRRSPAVRHLPGVAAGQMPVSRRS